MNLKEQIKLDASIFFNFNEFGEEIDVDGHLMPGFWDDTTEPGPQFHEVGGINMTERILFLHFAENSPLEQPVPGQVLGVDGTDWTVKEISDQGTIAKITLYQHVS